jgi:hypothetical protein
MTFMYNRDKEAKFRSALTKMQNAREEIEFLASGGLCDAEFVLAALDTAIGQFAALRAVAAAQYGFDIKAGM